MIKKINLLLPVLAFIMCNYLALNNMKISQALIHQVLDDPTIKMGNIFSENSSPSVYNQHVWGDVGLVRITEVPGKLNLEGKRAADQLFLSIEGNNSSLNSLWSGVGNKGLNLGLVGVSQNKSMMKTSYILLP